MKIYTYQGRKNVSGEKIRQMRNIKRMSQSDLAAKMQVEGVMLERDSISRIEGGERFVADYELRVFAKVLGVDVKYKTDVTVRSGGKNAGGRCDAGT